MAWSLCRFNQTLRAFSTGKAKREQERERTRATKQEKAPEMKVRTYLIPFDSIDERADVLVNGDFLPLHSQHLPKKGRSGVL